MECSYRSYVFHAVKCFTDLCDFDLFVVQYILNLFLFIRQTKLIMWLLMENLIMFIFHPRSLLIFFVCRIIQRRKKMSHKNDRNAIRLILKVYIMRTYSLRVGIFNLTRLRYLLPEEFFQYYRWHSKNVQLFYSYTPEAKMMTISQHSSTGAAGVPNNNICLKYDKNDVKKMQAHAYAYICVCTV